MAKNPLSKERAFEVIGSFMLLDGMIDLDYFICGSLRRGKDEVGDIDAIVVGAFPDTGPSMKFKESGAKKSRTYNYKRAQINFWAVPPELLGSAVMYATGSGTFNRHIRTLGIRKGYKLSQNGLVDRKTGKMIASGTEKEIFNKLGLKYIPPQYRSGKKMRALLEAFKLRGPDHAYVEPLIGRVYDRKIFSKEQQETMLPPKVDIMPIIDKGFGLTHLLRGKDA